MTRRASPRLSAYTLLSGAGLVGALASGRPELVALVAPMVVFLLTALVLAREPQVSWEVVVDERGLEGEPLALAVVLRAGGEAIELELELFLPPALVSAGGPSSTRRRIRLAAEEETRLELPLRARRWGAYALARGRIRALDPLRLFVWEAPIEPSAVVRVYPRPERLRALVAPRETQALVGSRVARARGDGTEFSDIRPFTPGDRMRRINWRASAHRGSLQVNERHPERNADVILFLDTFEEARSGETGTLDVMLSAAVSLAAGYLARRDRVGVVSFGGVLNWLEPALGSRALYRIADTLLQSEIVFSYVWKTVTVIPARLLPAGSLIVALTPLLDPRSTQALLDLRARGFDLAIVECAPEPFVAPARSEADLLARRLWVLERAAVRTRFRDLGVPVARFSPEQALQEALMEVIGSRRRARAPLPA